MLRHDALVIGGGPAGASAAITLALRGHSVAMVEQRAPSAEKSHRSWLIDHGSFRDLQQLEVNVRGHEITSVRFSHHQNGIERPLRDGAAFVITQLSRCRSIRSRGHTGNNTHY
ncbi:MAG: FAD-dependent oxidoreductase [Actinobacteria bacterium]|nr:FAD-dependent oxidoreductase [Actinomycetota bacterium]